MKRAVAAVVLILAAACAAGSPAESARVELDEFRIGVDAALWAAGRVDLTVVNLGEFGHTLVITDADGGVAGSADLIQPGQSAAVSFDLAPGDYQLTCRIVIETGDGAIVDHFEEGMLRDIVVAR